MKQKHYNSERAILADIYALQRKATAFLVEAEQHEQEAERLIHLVLKSGRVEADLQTKTAIEWEKGLAAKARRSAYRIENAKIPALRRTQDAFTTMTMPGIVDDNSVVIQK